MSRDIQKPLAFCLRGAPLHVVTGRVREHSTPGTQCSAAGRGGQPGGQRGGIACSADTPKEITSLGTGPNSFDAFQFLMSSEGTGRILGVI